MPGGVPEYSVTHSRVLVRSDGSFRQTQTDKPQTSKPAQMRDRADAADTAYDAASGVFRDYSRGWDWDAGGYVNRVEVTTGYPLGPPDRWANEQFDISATARALQADGAATLETASYDGRPVWVVSGSKRAADSGLSDDETYSITIDQQTCLPTRVQMLSEGVLQLDYSWHNVRVDEPLPDTAFTFAPPKGAKVVHKDAGFRRAAARPHRLHAGPRHAAADLAPAGYVQRWAAVAARSTTANGVTEGRDVVAVQYVRGFDALTVTTRTVADPQAAATIDPVEPDTSWADIVRRDVRLTAGAFAGVTARVVVASYIDHPPPLRGQGRRLADDGRRRDGQGADRDRRVASALPTGSRLGGRHEDPRGQMPSRAVVGLGHRRAGAADGDARRHVAARRPPRE